ncbi:hypothetical protein K501DRAFT_261820 [Backusella circina FSU 941]|nr:hypothetical protein K501DRAFT_261820 [Backusella circina FSU 941]
MSHFRFPRTSNSIEEELFNSVVLSDSGGEELSYSSSGDTSDSSTILAPRPTQEERRCWICFGDISDSQGKWVKPCKCSLEAHQKCLLEWIAEKQKGSLLKKVQCPQCSTTYHIVQNNNIRIMLLNFIDTLVRTGTPYVTAIGLGCTCLISCSTYGAFTVMTLFGQREGERLIGNPSLWTWKTWTGLPLIPIILLTAQTRWGDAILPVAAVTTLRATGNTPNTIRFTWPMSPALTIGILPWIRLFYNNAFRIAHYYVRKSLSIPDRLSTLSRNQSTTNNDRNMERNIIYGMDTSSTSVSIVGALLWPVTSSLMGGFLSRFKCVRDNFGGPFQRNILGGCLFILAKDIVNLLYRYERIRQYRSRRVMDYDEVIKRK